MRGRIGTSIDVNRLAAGISRPGIDPRTWVSLAVAIEEEHLDKDHGIFVEVLLLPTGEELTCRVGQDYAGAAFGTHEQTIHKDDQLLIAIPSGDPSHGGVVLKRFWTGADKPAQLALDNPADFVRVQEKDTNVRLTLQGKGQWLFVGEDEIIFKNSKKSTYDTETFIAKTSNVRLGSEQASHPVIKGDTYRNAEDQMLTQLKTAQTLMQVAASMLSSAGAQMAIPIAGAVMAGPQMSAAGAQVLAAANIISTAITTFTSPAPNYLSTISNTD